MHLPISHDSINEISWEFMKCWRAGRMYQTWRKSVTLSGRTDYIMTEEPWDKGVSRVRNVSASLTHPGACEGNYHLILLVTVPDDSDPIQPNLTVHNPLRRNSQSVTSNHSSGTTKYTPLGSEAFLNSVGAIPTVGHQPNHYTEVKWLKPGAFPSMISRPSTVSPF